MEMKGSSTYGTHAGLLPDVVEGRSADVPSLLLRALLAGAALLAGGADRRLASADRPFYDFVSQRASAVSRRLYLLRTTSYSFREVCKRKLSCKLLIGLSNVVVVGRKF